MTDPRTRSPRSLLTPAVLHILLSLADGVKHGYGIKQDVEERTDGTLSLGPATLYEAIQRLLKAEWIEEVSRPPTEGDRSDRRFYTITAVGRSHMQDELGRLAVLVDYAASRSLLPGSQSRA